jgi:hypothetical protein
MSNFTATGSKSEISSPAIRWTTFWSGELVRRSEPFRAVVYRNGSHQLNLGFVAPAQPNQRHRIRSDVVAAKQTAQSMLALS